MTMYGLNLDGLGADSRQASLQRTLVGALYGFLGGMAFAWMSAFIDIWLHPDLPIGMNWSALWLRAPVFGLGLAAMGAVTCWWHAAWQGLFGGALTAAALVLISTLFSAQAGAGVKVIMLVVMLVPLAIMILPVAYLLRWLMEHHTQAMHMQPSGLRMAGLVLMALIVGAGGGYFMKASASSLEAIRFVDGLLQASMLEKNPLDEVKGLPEHADMPYTLYSTRSAVSTEGYDIHIRYADGYQVLCTVVVYPGRDPYFSACGVAPTPTP